MTAWIWKARLRALEDREAIKEVTHKYARCLDNLRWDEMRDCFTEDATTSYTDGAHSFSGIDTIIGFLSKAHTRERRLAGQVGTHVLVHPEIKLTSAVTARAIWAFTYTTLDAVEKKGGGQAAYYHNEYVKRDGQWKISHIGYKLAYAPQYELPGLGVGLGKFAYTGGDDDAAAGLSRPERRTGGPLGPGALSSRPALGRSPSPRRRSQRP